MITFDLPPNSRQYRLYYKILSDYAETNDIDKKAIPEIHKAFKDYIGIKTIKRNKITKLKFQKYISTVEMLLARERGYSLNK